MREWLIAIGVLVFLGIMLDCLRRMRSAKRDTLDMGAIMQQGIRGDVLANDNDELNAELPAGGARVVEKHDAANTVSAAKESQPKIDLEQIVPMLMDEGATNEDSEGSSSSLNRYDDGDRREPTFNNNRDMLMGSGESAVLSQPRTIERTLSGSGKNSGSDSSDEKVQEVIIVNVMSRQAEGFQGAALLENLLSCGMRFGQMNIFHCYSGNKGEGDVLYSMANLVKPGTFDLNNMGSFKTPGVSFFLNLPLVDNNISSMETFDSMLNTAQQLVANLDGELKDEQRSVMTGQTIEHCRQRISDFSRKMLSRSSSNQSSVTR